MHVRRSGTGFGILGTLLLVLAACGGGSSSQSSTAPIMIGVIQPFSGSISYYGTWTMDAVNLVLKQKGDTINGHKIQFIQEDDQCTPGPAVTAAEKLIGRVVAVLGPDCSGDMAAVEPVLKNAQIPHLCPCYLASLSQQNDNYFFREGPSDGPMLQVLIDYMKAQGVNKVAMLTDTTGYGQGERDAFLAGLTKDGMNPPALDLTFDVSTTDFSGQIGRILSAKVDAVLMGSYEDTEGLIAKQARQLGLTVPFYAGSAAAESTFWKVGGQAAEGTVFSSFFTPTDPQTLDFQNAFKSSYGFDADSVSVGAGLAMYALIQVFQNMQGDITGPKIRDALAKLDITTPAGRAAWASSGELQHPFGVLGVIKNQAIVTIKRETF